MFTSHHNLLCRGLIGVTLGLFLGFSGFPAQAAPITYTEILDDVDDTGSGVLSDIGQDLERTRILGTGTVLMESDDLTIISENNMDPTIPGETNFGVSTPLPGFVPAGPFPAPPIEYSHIFVGVPPVATFLSGELTLEVFSVSGGADPNASGLTQFFQLLFGIGPVPDDPIEIDGVMVGVLTPGSPITVSTTMLGFTGAEISLLLSDDQLDVGITPAGLGALFLDPDTLAVRTSTLVVNYEPVPEPSTMLLLGSGLAGLFAWRLRKGRA